MTVLESDMKSELPKSIRKNDLVDWLLDKQTKMRLYCHDITVKELMRSAERCKIKVVKN